MGCEYENRNIIESFTDISCDPVASITMRLQTFTLALIFQSNNIGDYTYFLGGTRIVPPQEIYNVRYGKIFVLKYHYYA